MVTILRFLSLIVRSPFPRRAFVLAVGLGVYAPDYSIAASTPSATTTPDKEHRAAIALARSGRYDAALERLSALMEAHPSRKTFLYDYIAVLSWAGHDEKAVAPVSRIELSRTPDYVLFALGKSARNQQQPELAIKIYETILKRNSGNEEARMGLALSLAEAGNPHEAERKLKALLKRKPRSPGLLEAVAYVRQLDGNHTGAIAAYEKLLKIAPNNRTARRGRIVNLVQVGAAHQAVRLLEQESPDLFEPEEREQIIAHRNAQAIRWGELPTAHPARRHADTERAIALLQEQYEKMEDKTAPAALRNRFDLILAYRNRNHADKAVALYERLIDQGVTRFPPYVQAAAGESYLSLRQPERAIELLEPAIEKYPDDLDARYALYYAYLESGRYEKSLAYIDALADSLPAREWRPDNKEWEWSVDKLYARTIAAQARAHVGRLDVAAGRLEELLEQAPADPDVRNALASVALWRGWPRRAQTEYRIVLAQDPENLGARIGTIRAMSARGDIRMADEMLGSLLPYYEDDLHVRELLREAAVRNMREIWIGINGGSSSSLYQGSKEITMEGYYYDHPWQSGLRPFLHLLHGEADFSGQTATRDRMAIGLHYRKRDTELRGSISNGEGTPGISLKGTREFTDHWRGTLALDSYSTEAPLQAKLHGIDAWAVQAGMEYRFHESRSLGFSTQHMGFDDGNRRNIVIAYGRQRLHTGMRYRLDGRLTLYRQTNSEKGAPYFNPSRQTSWELEFHNRWETWRRYEKSMHQRLLVMLGRNSQRGFDSESTWQIGYEHHWSFSRQLSLSYGISRARPVYDGKQEYTTRGFINLYARF